MRRYTPAQKRALLWYPEDGQWKTNPGRLVAALHSLAHYHKGLAEAEFGDFGPRGGRTMRWRLTPLGVEARKELAS